MKDLSFIVYVGFLFVFGTALLIFPRTVQRIAIRHAAKGGIWPPQAIKTFISSPAYLWNLRTVGLLALATAVFMLWAAAR
jgi:hypothetical protein